MGEGIVIRVGMGTCAMAAGAKKVFKQAQETLAGLDIDAKLIQVGCIGMCYAEVMMDIKLPGKTTVMLGDLTPENTADVLSAFFEDAPNLSRVKGNVLGQFKNKDSKTDEYFEGIDFFEELEFNKKQVKIVLSNCGLIDPLSMDDYMARGGYEAARKALTQMDADTIISQIKESGLRGRGGGGFPTGMKWEFGKQSQSDRKYLICNADEGDPGAFMDRSVLEGDPHAVIEGMIIAAKAIGADTGYIYVRAEYPMAVKHLEVGLKAAAEKGFLGRNIFGSGFDLELKIKKGAGAFVCGEETALMRSIEGYRGTPSLKPPFPTTSGLFGKPTVINNVETLASVPRIIDKGAQWYSSFGTEKSKGTKTFAITGKVQNTGLIEVPMGITLREIVYDIGGGVAESAQLKGIQTGGPSGGCIPASLIDTRVEYETLSAIGAIMGSGGMVVMDDTTCMVDTAKYFLEFDQGESCGKCTPCRVGTKRMVEILARLGKGRGTMEDIDLLISLGEVIQETSLCGLGQTAPNPTLSTIKYFMDEYKEHVTLRKCPVKQKTKARV